MLLRVSFFSSKRAALSSQGAHTLGSHCLSPDRPTAPPPALLFWGGSGAKRGSETLSPPKCFPPPVSLGVNVFHVNRITTASQHFPVLYRDLEISHPRSAQWMTISTDSLLGMHLKWRQPVRQSATFILTTLVPLPWHRAMGRRRACLQEIIVVGDGRRGCGSVIGDSHWTSSSGGRIIKG